MPFERELVALLCAMGSRFSVIVIIGALQFASHIM